MLRTSMRLAGTERLRQAADEMENIYMNNKQVEIPFRKRNNYAYGMVLGAKDFQQEFSYFYDRMKLHNRMLHGYGTVTGLEVSSDEETATDIVVNAGMAIDPEGNEIILPSTVQCPFPEEGEEAYLVLYWAERDTDPVPISGAESDMDQIVPSRVEEYAILKYEADQGEAKQTGVVLARLQNAGGKWEVDKKFRVRRARAK
jgi:hypothetical protein